MPTIICNKTDKKWREHVPTVVSPLSKQVRGGQKAVALLAMTTLGNETPTLIRLFLFVVENHQNFRTLNGLHLNHKRGLK
jgi:hypothetical protein